MKTWKGDDALEGGPIDDPDGAVPETLHPFDKIRRMDAGYCGKIIKIDRRYGGKEREKTAVMVRLITQEFTNIHKIFW